jgi:uncharacterized protein YbdZ (MbtH family)
MGSPEVPVFVMLPLDTVRFSLWPVFKAIQKENE